MTLNCCNATKKMTGNPFFQSLCRESVLSNSNKLNILTKEQGKYTPGKAVSSWIACKKTATFTAALQRDKALDYLWRVWFKPSGLQKNPHSHVTCGWEGAAEDLQPLGEECLKIGPHKSIHGCFNPIQNPVYKFDLNVKHLLNSSVQPLSPLSLLAEQTSLQSGCAAELELIIKSTYILNMLYCAF